MSLIESYIPNAWPDAGDTGADATKMVAPFNTGLLHLMNHLMHTKTGRIFMHSLIPGQNGHTAQSIRQPLLDKFAEFGVTGPVTEALIGAHIAGFAWADGFNAIPKDTAKMEQQEAIFKQHTSAVAWFLWEESQGPMFSLGW
jgi:hypothetical protein